MKPEKQPSHALCLCTSWFWSNVKIASNASFNETYSWTYNTKLWWSIISFENYIVISLQNIRTIVISHTSIINYKHLQAKVGKWLLDYSFHYAYRILTIIFLVWSKWIVYVLCGLDGHEPSQAILLEGVNVQWCGDSQEMDPPSKDNVKWRGPSKN